MFFVIGILIVFGSVFGAYSVHGSMAILWQPLEFVIILGGGLGAFILGNPKRIVTGALKNFGKVIKGPKYGRAEYVELLGCLYSVFRLAKTKGDLALESHVERPQESTLFANFPTLQGDHHASEFMCDYLRLLTLGASNSHELETVMDEELAIHHEEKLAISSALKVFADALPALGIVAAVLGVIVTMSSITEPPEILGGLIAAALVGTFSGIFVSYGVVAPFATSMEAAFNHEHHYLLCIKAGLVGHVQGYAPQVSVEFARKLLPDDVRPSFAEVEEMIGTLPTPG